MIVALLLLISIIVYIILHNKHKKDKDKKDIDSTRSVASYIYPKLRFSSSAESSQIRPKNGLGKSVDWFVVFKLPNKSKNCSNSLGDCSQNCTCACSPSGFSSSNCDLKDDKRASGECYFYADSEDSTLRYYTDLNFGCLSEGNNPLSMTMNQLKLGKWALWNDQGVSSSCSAPHAHSKGAVCYNEQGGFILNTSSPHWPNSDLQTLGCQKIDNSEYAQHIFCFSASSNSIEKWLNAANNASLCITESSFMNKGSLPGGNTPQPFIINTLGMTAITVMMKGSSDYYLPWSLVSETLKKGIKIASWTSESNADSSGWGDASRYNNSSESLTQVLDINTPNGCFKSLYSYSHSKWAISDTGDWVIFGSMNMQNSQAGRGGDFYAFENPSLWKSLNSFISNTKSR